MNVLKSLSYATTYYSNQFVKWIPFILAMMAGGVGAFLGGVLVPDWQITALLLGFLTGAAFISLFILLLYRV